MNNEALSTQAIFPWQVYLSIFAAYWNDQQVFLEELFNDKVFFARVDDDPCHIFLVVCLQEPSKFHNWQFFLVKEKRAC